MLTFWFFRSKLLQKDSNRDKNALFLDVKAGNIHQFTSKSVEFFLGIIREKS